MTAEDKTPDALLSEQILADLKKKRLFSEKQLKSLREKLASGKLKAADWQVMIELSVSAEAKKDV
ncbi:MAG: hypothetical protein ABII00_17750 [Elusimicrobiota bacterium]